MKSIIILVLLTNCTFHLNRTHHGAVLFKTTSKPLTVTNERIEIQACNKMFLLIPYKLEMFRQEEFYQENLEKNNAVGFANVKVEENAFTNFFVTSWCQSMKGYLLR
jgi:hypothetical protein